MPRLFLYVLALLLPLLCLAGNTTIDEQLTRLSASHGQFEFCDAGVLCENAMFCLTLESGQLWLQRNTAAERQWRSSWLKANAEEVPLVLPDWQINHWLEQWLNNHYTREQQKTLRESPATATRREDLIALSIVQQLDTAHSCIPR